jgi:hypothetical protein
VNSWLDFCWGLLKYLSMDEETEESLSKQMLNMVLENNTLRDTVFPFITGYVVFNILILTLLIYVSVRISLR